jgi:hypothetical protein
VHLFQQFGCKSLHGIASGSGVMGKDTGKDCVLRFGRVGWPWPRILPLSVEVLIYTFSKYQRPIKVTANARFSVAYCAALRACAL